MFERFTERARQVVVLAQEEARALRHNYIGTEHILLGLLREEEGLAARALANFDVSTDRVRAQVVRIVGRPGRSTSEVEVELEAVRQEKELAISSQNFAEAASARARERALVDELAENRAQEAVQLPFTPRAKKVMELALREALHLGHNYIGTQHILLGVLREGDGVAVRILGDFDAPPAGVRDEVVRMLMGRRTERAKPVETTKETADKAPPNGPRAVAGPMHPHTAVPVSGVTGRHTCVRTYAENFVDAAHRAVRELPPSTVHVIVVNEVTGETCRVKIGTTVELLS